MLPEHRSHTRRYVPPGSICGEKKPFLRDAAAPAAPSVTGPGAARSAAICARMDATCPLTCARTYAARRSSVSAGAEAKARHASASYASYAFDAAFDAAFVSSDAVVFGSRVCAPLTNRASLSFEGPPVSIASASARRSVSAGGSEVGGITPSPDRRPRLPSRFPGVAAGFSAEVFVAAFSAASLPPRSRISRARPDSPLASRASAALSRSALPAARSSRDDLAGASGDADFSAASFLSFSPAPASRSSLAFAFSPSLAPFLPAAFATRSRYVSTAFFDRSEGCMLPLTYSPFEPAFSNGVSSPFLSKRLNTWSEWSPPPARCVDCTHTSFRWCLNRSYSLPCGFLYPGKGFSDQNPGAPTSSAASRLFRSALLRSAPVPPVEVRDALGALPRDDPAASCLLASPTVGALAFSPGLPASRPPRVSRRSSFFAGLSLFASPPTPGGGGLYTSGALRSRLVATGAALMSSSCSCLISAAVSGSRSAPKNPGSGAGGAEGVPRVERPIAAASDTSFLFPPLKDTDCAGGETQQSREMPAADVTKMRNRRSTRGWKWTTPGLLPARPWLAPPAVPHAPFEPAFKRMRREND